MSCQGEGESKLEMVIILNLEPLHELFLTNIMVNIKVLKMGWEKEY